MTRRAIGHRLATGRLHLLHREVYAVGHAAVTPLGRDLAAVLACGPGAVLGGRSAAVVWELLERRAGRVDVVRAGPRRDSRPGIEVHRTESLPPEDVGRVAGIPVTSPERTVLDLAADGSPETERALNEARLRRLVDDRRLLERAAGRRGAGVLRELLADGPALTRSEAERVLLALVRRAGLPRPATNVRIGRWEVDALWPAERLVVEVDGYRFHRDRLTFERDRHKANDLQATGYRVLRLTWRQITNHPEHAAVTLATTLNLGATAAARPSP